MRTKSKQNLLSSNYSLVMGKIQLLVSNYSFNGVIKFHLRSYVRLLIGALEFFSEYACFHLLNNTSFSQIPPVHCFAEIYIFFSHERPSATEKKTSSAEKKGAELNFISTKKENRNKKLRPFLVYRFFRAVKFSTFVPDFVKLFVVHLRSFPLTML